MEAVTNEYDDIFLDLGNKTRNKPWVFELFSCFYCLFLQLGFIFLRRMH